MREGTALFEKTSYVERFGNPLNNNLADNMVTRGLTRPRSMSRLCNRQISSSAYLGAPGTGEVGWLAYHSPL